MFGGNFYPVVTDLYKISVEKTEKSKPVLNFGLEIHNIPPKILVGSVYRWICGLSYFGVPVEK